MPCHRVDVDGTSTVFSDGGSGPPLVFLHGWGLGSNAYHAVLRAMRTAGHRVIAPALPGFGGTANLPAAQLSLPGYARWLASLLAHLVGDDPVSLVGHSFGGGVALQTAHDHPDRVSRLILVNSIGGGEWTRCGETVRLMAQRPLWNWCLCLPADLLSPRQWTRTLPAIGRDLVPNLYRNPGALWRVGNLARRADLTRELEVLRRRRLPISILWGQHDNVLGSYALASLRQSLDARCVTVAGRHSWLLHRPVLCGALVAKALADDERETDASPPAAAVA